MSTGKRILQFSGMLVLCLASASYAAQTAHRHKQAKKDPPPPPLPSGPTGPVQQIPLDSMPPVAPHVTYDKGQLTIVAANSTLSDILRAVKKQTGADIDVPDARERVVTHLGPGPAQEIISELLNGSRFNYVLLGSAQNPEVLTRVVLVPRTPESNRPNQALASLNQPQQPDQPQPDMGADSSNDSDASVPEENAVDDTTAEQPAATDEEQPAQQPDQPAVKTPQQLLQEMQQRQLMMQQQQPSGQPPAPPPGVQRPQQEQ
jgi:hypothetical protein